VSDITFSNRSRNSGVWEPAGGLRAMLCQS